MTTHGEALRRGASTRRFTKVAFLGLMIAALLLLSACAQAPFRLHVIANSNTDADQQVKLAVRDAVLSATASGMNECQDKNDAKEYLLHNLEIIEETANETLADNGFYYTAQAEIGTFYFPERTYQDVTYPEGDYEALRLTLGEGEGENWWCVMFPPLCLTEMDAISEGDEVEYTSFFAELFGSLFG